MLLKEVFFKKVRRVGEVGHTGTYLRMLYLCASYQEFDEKEKSLWKTQNIKTEMSKWVIYDWKWMSWE